MTQFGGLKAVGRKFSRSLKMALEVQKFSFVVFTKRRTGKATQERAAETDTGRSELYNALGKNDFAPQHEMEGRNVRREEDCAACTQAD